LPYEIWREEIVTHNLPYGLRDNYLHRAIVTDPEGETAVKVWLRGNGEDLWVSVMRGDEDGEARLPVTDLIAAVGALRQVEGLKPDPLNPYLDAEGEEEAARVIAEAAGALKTHAAHGMDELAASLEATGLQLIGLASSRDYATTSIPVYVLEQRIREWQEQGAQARRMTADERQSASLAEPEFYDGLVQGGQSILNLLNGKAS
jgi:hypothetical protein